MPQQNKNILHKIELAPSADNKSTLHIEHWVSEDVESGTQQPRGIVQLVHGMREYIGRYSRIANILAAQGYVVVGNDHIGHGDTAPSKDELGHAAIGEGSNQIIADLKGVFHREKDRWPGVPAFILGHSMGSFYARVLSVELGDELAGVIISGTAWHPPALLESARAFLRLMAHTRGPYDRSKFVQRLALGNSNKQFQPEKTPVDWLSRDEQVCQEHMNDPKCDYIFSIGGFHEMLTTLQRACSTDFIKQTPADLPILIISGDKDPVGDNGLAPRRLKFELERAGVKDVDMIIYPGARHEVLNEINHEEVEEDILTWLHQVLL